MQPLRLVACEADSGASNNVLVLQPHPNFRSRTHVGPIVDAEVLVENSLSTLKFGCDDLRGWPYLRKTAVTIVGSFVHLDGAVLISCFS
jgi:hypothetical protein